MLLQHQRGWPDPAWAEPLEPRVLLASQIEFADEIDNPYLPLISGATYIYRGVNDAGVSVRSRVTVLNERAPLMGTPATVVRERVYHDNEMISDTRSYYAQDNGGNVWKLGQDSRGMLGGVVISSEGSWTAGVDGATPWIVMPAPPATGDALPENASDAPTRIVATDESAKAPFATFANCLRIEMQPPQGPPTPEQGYYAPGIGLVSSQAVGGERTVLRLAHVHLAPEAFAETVDNSYFPLAPGTTFIYRGVDRGVSLRQRVTVTHETREITGVATTIVRAREYEEGELVEDTREFYAQDKAGNVWYFGEDSRQIEDGILVGTEGSWQAGVDGAKPGIFMRSHPAAGDLYRVEDAPGIAEDFSRVLGIQETLHVPYARFQNVLRIADSSPLEPDDLEIKYYVAGAGFVMEESEDGEDVENFKLGYVLIE